MLLSSWKNILLNKELFENIGQFYGELVLSRINQGQLRLIEVNWGQLESTEVYWGQSGLIEVNFGQLGLLESIRVNWGQ